MRGLSRLKLSAKIGVSDSQIFKYEAGHDHVSASTLLDISNVLNVPIILFMEHLAASKHEAPAADELTLPDEAAVFAAYRRIAPRGVQMHVAHLILALATQGEETKDRPDINDR